MTKLVRCSRARGVRSCGLERSKNHYLLAESLIGILSFAFTSLYTLDLPGTRAGRTTREPHHAAAGRDRDWCSVAASRPRGQQTARGGRTERDPLELSGPRLGTEAAPHRLPPRGPRKSILSDRCPVSARWGDLSSGALTQSTLSAFRRSATRRASLAVCPSSLRRATLRRRPPRRAKATMRRGR